MNTLRITSGEVEVELLPELGGRMHRLRAFGHDLLRTPDDMDAYRREPFFWGSFVMAPWCNRIAAGRQEIGGAVVDLPPNFPDGTAIHGEVQALPWDVVAPRRLRVVAGGGGWPWRYEATQQVEVAGSRLRIVLAVTNRTDGAMPAGIGIHPWLVRPLDIAITADEVYPYNEDPGGEPRAVRGEHDLRALRPMPVDLDATWITGTASPVRLRWPEARVGASLDISPEAAYICAASPASLNAVALEAQTHAPFGLRRLAEAQRGGLRWLQPGESLTLQVGVSFFR